MADSRQTWEQQVIAALIEVIDEQGVGLVRGIDVSADGEVTFDRQGLNETEVARIEESLSGVREHLAERQLLLGLGDLPEGFYDVPDFDSGDVIIDDVAPRDLDLRTREEWSEAGYLLVAG